MMREQVAPVLRQAGFTGTFLTFKYANGDYAGTIRVQKSRHNSRQRVEFTLHVGAPCLGSAEIFKLMPGSSPGRWWEVRAGQPTGPIADSVISAIRRYGLPAILTGLDDPGHQLDPVVPWARTFPPQPPSRRLPDGHGADPAAWFVQPAGTGSDDSFAELTSECACYRLGAAEAIAENAAGDPRALPALLDRLEQDPSPMNRYQIAARLLTSAAQDPRVRSALRAAAAEDEDLQVRWAARYALRLVL